MTALELKQALMDAAEPLAALTGRTATGARLRVDWALQRLLGEPLAPATPCLARPGDQSKCRGDKRGHRRSLQAQPGGSEAEQLAA